MTREEEIQARLDAATPGEWKQARFEGGRVDPCVEADRGRLFIDVVLSDDGDEGLNDAAFIANAPDDLRYLLAENARLRDEVERFGVKFYPSDRNANEIAEAFTKPCPSCGGDGSAHDGDWTAPDGPCGTCDAWGRVEA